MKLKNLLVHPKNKVPILDTVFISSEGKGTAAVTITDLQNIVVYTVPYTGPACRYLVDKEPLRGIKDSLEFEVLEEGLSVAGSGIPRSEIVPDDFPAFLKLSGDLSPMLVVTDWSKFIKHAMECVETCGGEKNLVIDKSVLTGGYKGKPYIMASSASVLVKIDTKTAEFCGTYNDPRTRLADEHTALLLPAAALKMLNKISLKGEIKVAVSGVFHSELAVFTGQDFQCVILTKSKNSIPSAISTRFMKNLSSSGRWVQFDKKEFLKLMSEFKENIAEIRKEAYKTTKYSIPVAYVKMIYNKDNLDGSFVDPVSSHVSGFCIKNPANTGFDSEETVAVNLEFLYKAVKCFAVDRIEDSVFRPALKLLKDDRQVIIMGMKV